MRMRNAVSKACQTLTRIVQLGLAGYPLLLILRRKNAIPYAAIAAWRVCYAHHKYAL